jgi:hypothetical protein
MAAATARDRRRKGGARPVRSPLRPPPPRGIETARPEERARMEPDDEDDGDGDDFFLDVVFGSWTW